MESRKIILVSKKVQLAVQLIDDYSDEMISNDIKVFIEGELKPPILNKSGYFVFTRLEGVADTLIIKSKYYFDEIIKINLEDYKDDALIVCRMIPNTIYPFPSKATLIRGKVSKLGIRLRIKAISDEMAFGRVIKPYKIGDEEINIVKTQGRTHTNMLYNIKSVTDDYDEFCIIDDCLKDKGVYRLRSKLICDYPRGSLLLFANNVRIDDRNQFTIYFNQLNALECKFIICLEDKNVEVTVKEGKTLNIGLVN